MSSKRKQKKRKGGSQGEPAVCSISEPLHNPTEVSTPAKMPSGFNVDDFLFSKLYKSVNVEGKRTIMEAVKAFVFHQGMPKDSSACTVGQIFGEERKTKSIIARCGRNFLEKSLVTADFDITCGIMLLQLFDEYEKLSRLCKVRIHSLRELRNSLSHKYPLALHDIEANNEKLNGLFEESEESLTLVNEIKILKEKKKEVVTDAERKEIQDHIDEKKKEKYVVTEIEKLRIVLNDIMENVSNILEKDFRDCKRMVDENLTDIIKAKVQEYDQDTYDTEIKSFKDDPLHELITMGRKELMDQYRRLKIANPCPWIVMDQNDKISLANFRIENIFTPLRIEGSRKEITSEELLTVDGKSKIRTVIPDVLVLSGLAGSGKTSLCLHYLHHWTEGTNEIETLKDYNLVIYVELRNVRSSTIVSYLKEERMKKSTLHIKAEDLVQQLDELRLLFIIDGYDEATKKTKNVVKDIFAKFPKQGILVTTRREFQEELCHIIKKANISMHKFEVCGFDEFRREKFTEKVFNAVKQSKWYQNKLTYGERSPSKFMDYVRSRGHILEKHLELPLTLALMIYMWIDCPDVLHNVTTCTSLYYELFKLCQKKLKSRLSHPVSERDTEKLLIFIGKKALQLLSMKEDVLSDEDEKEIDKECEKKQVPKGELLSAFLMYEPDDDFDEQRYDYSFMHRTQMEYLAAYFWAEEMAERGLNVVTEPISSLSGHHQIIIFLVGHLTIKKNLDQKLREVFELLAEADIQDDDFDFWWRLLTESQINGNPNRNLSGEIGRKINMNEWKLLRDTVIPGLELLIATPVQIKELSIDIDYGTDPYDIKDFFEIMTSLKKKLERRYNKKGPLLVQLFFLRHAETSCEKPSNALLRTLYPWGHLKDFVGSIGAFDDKFMLNYCYKVKNLRIRIETGDALISLSNSLKSICKGVRNLRVTLALKPKECDPETLACLNYDDFKGKLEVTLPLMNDEDKYWIVDVLKKVSGSHGCHKLILKKSSVRVCTVLYIMEKLRHVVMEWYKIDSSESPTDKELYELEKQKRKLHVDVDW